MGASNYKTIMPAMEQQDKSALVQLLHYTPLDYLKITVEWGFKVINGTKRVKRKVHLLKEESHLLKEVPSQQPSLTRWLRRFLSFFILCTNGLYGPPNYYQSYQKKYKLPETSRLGCFSDRPWSVSSLVKVSGVSAASAFAWLRTPRHRRSWGSPALLMKDFWDESKLWGISWSFVEGLQFVLCCRYLT